MDQQAYQQAVREYTARLYRFVKKSLIHEASTKDIVQEALARLWECHHNISSEKAKTWLFTTAYRLMIDELKRQGKFTDEVNDENICYDNSVQNADLKEVLQLCLNKLPVMQKQVILLRDLEGYAYNEIGEILLLKESQVKVYLFRARHKMKELLLKLEVNA